jgi:tetratricopeptide (TPR) repeat protein
LCQGKSDLALREAEKALSVHPTSIYPSLVGDIYHCKGHLVRAEKAYQKILESEETASQYYGRFRLAALYLSQGRFEDSKRQLKKTSALAERVGDTQGQMWAHSYLAQLDLASGEPEEALEEWKKAQNMALQGDLDWRLSLHLKGLIYLKMKSMGQARRTADELRRMLRKRMNKKLMRYYHPLVGMIELEKGNFSRAIASFETALSLLPFQHSELDDHALFLYPLATALYKAGELENAQKQYKKITSLTTGRLFYGDIFARSLHMLGKIYDEKGWQERATEHYGQFFGYWKDADSGIPEVEEAKERLTRLKAES